MAPTPLDGGAQEGAPDTATGVIGMDRELLEVRARADGVDATQANGRVAGDEDDQRGGECVHGAWGGQRADAERLEQGVRCSFERGQQRQFAGPHRAHHPGGPLWPHGPCGGDGVHVA